MLQQESHKGRLETYSKMTARNPADKVHYIVRFRDWRLTHSVTLALDVPQTGTVGSSEFNNRRLLAFQPSLRLSWPHIFPAKEWEILLLFHESNLHFIREKPSFSQQCLCHLIQ